MVDHGSGIAFLLKFYDGDVSKFGAQLKTTWMWFWDHYEIKGENIVEFEKREHKELCGLAW